MILSIILGLLGLGLVVLVHELGHYVAARAMGVEVEAFSIGWGPRLAGFRRGRTEWRISAFPIGGYCRMKGEEAFRKALEERSGTMPAEPGSFYGAAPWRRIVISLAGPMANAVLAVLVFFLVAAVGYEVPTNPNRIVLASEFSLDGSAPPTGLPADLAGLRSGDRIVRLGSAPIADYLDLQEAVGKAAGRELEVEYEREGLRGATRLVPALDRETGAGRIGVYSWIEPIVDTVAAGSAADIAGLRPGDRLVASGGKPVAHAIEFLATLASKPERLRVDYLREGTAASADLVLSWDDSGASRLGVGFGTETHRKRAASLGAAFADGAAEAWESLSLSLRGILLLFRGVDPFKAISGPARITWLVGSAASEGLGGGAPSGFMVAVEFLGFLSIGLFLMNLLPIPALDGGQIVMFLVEWLRGKPLKALTVYRYQFVGSSMIFVLLIIATIGDVLFFSGR